MRTFKDTIVESMLYQFIVRNQDIDSHKAIFLTTSKINIKLKELKDSANSENILSIVFNQDVAFVDPLFFSLTLLFYDQYKSSNIILVFDVLNFVQDKKYDYRDPRQHYIARILLSMIDTPHFLPYLYSYEDQIDSFREKLENHIKNKVSGNIYVDNQGNEIKKSIVLLYSRRHKDSIFMDSEKDKIYKLLPIIKLTNFPDYIYTNGLLDNEFDARKHVYQSITISYDSNYDSKVLKENFEKYFIDIVKPDKYQSSISQPLKDIFFEMVDNIKRHAKYDDKYADSYFNFYYDVSQDIFKFHIIDNLDTGFINTYIKTIQNDKQRLINEGLEVEEFYDEALKILHNIDNDEDFLKSLFSEHGWFRASKIPRIILHFGFPLLAEIIKFIGGSAYIRLHRVHDDGNRFYEITINKTGTITKEITDNNSQIKGTYITIDIPNKSYAPPPVIKRSLGKKDFKSIENKKDEILKASKAFIDGAKNEQQYAIYNFENYTKGSVADFIRLIYIKAHQKKLSDVLVIGIDLKENIEYFKTLAYLLYEKDYKDNDEYLPINILFWNSSSFDIFFVGGKNRYEFCRSNELLYKHYGQKNYFIKDKFCPPENKSPAQSIFFIEGTNGELLVLPFELLIEDIISQSDDNVWKKISYQRTIIDHLEKNKLNIHFDTQRGYHIDGFYKFDTIFQDSSFFERIAIDLIRRIENDKSLQNRKLAFVGVGKYLNLFMAIVLDALKDKHINLFSKYYIVAGIHKDDSGVKEFIEETEKNTKANEDVAFIIVTSVSFDGKRTNELIKKYFGVNCTWYNLIKISLQDIPKHNIPNTNNLLEIEIPRTNYHDLSDDNECSICTNPDKEVPLLKVSDSDEFKIENTYFGRYKNKKFIKSFSMGQVKFYNALSVGHIERGRYNHYLYYTKTVNFFDKNEGKIKHNFLSKIKVDSTDMAILLLPMHCTVNRFASRVYRLIFDGKAKIFQLDKSKGIKNFHELKSLLGDDVSKYTFYFIDDEISSGYTVEYFYSLVKSLGGEGFEKMFILIDRLDSSDENLVLNFLKSKDQKDIHIFSKLEVKPIKTEIESCFLCERRNQYKEMLNDTTMEMNRFAIAKRIVKLNIQDSKLFDFENQQEFTTDNFRTYLKVYAADYVYENFNNIYLDKIETKDRAFIVRHYNDFETNFIEKVYEKISRLSLKAKNKPENEALMRNIASYEGSIILLKALSMPKLAYYYSIRYMLTIVLIEKIRNFSKNDPIAPYFDKGLKSFVQKQNDKKYSNFLEHFLSKINMNYLNFLYKTASYFNIHYVIHKDNVLKYCEAVQAIKGHDPDASKPKPPSIDQSLVEYYQLASKLVASYSHDRAMYFKNSVDSIFSTKDRTKCDSLLSALLLENHYDNTLTNFQKDCKNILDSNEKPSEVISKIEKKLQDIMEDNSLRLRSLYVNKNMDLLYSDYASYLDALDLIDVVNQYSPPLSGQEDIEYKLTKGFLSARKDEIFDPNNGYFRKRINNTWSNLFIKNYVVPEGTSTSATLIRLVDINLDKLDTDPLKKMDLKSMVKKNDNLWHKPIGCLVISYGESSKQKKKHLKLSKYLLTIQGEIVAYLKKKFSTGVIQEAIQTKEYENIFSTFNHEVAPLFELNQIIENIIQEQDITKKENLLKKLYNYATFAESLTKVGRVKKYTDIKKIPNPSAIQEFFKTYTPVINDFFTLYDSFIEERQNYQNIQLSLENLNNFKIPLSETFLKILFFELLFNSYKYSPDQDKKIKIYLLNNKQLCIENTIGEGKEEKGNKIALKNLQFMLNKIDWELETVKKNSKFVAKIYEKEK